MLGRRSAHRLLCARELLKLCCLVGSLVQSCAHEILLLSTFFYFGGMQEREEEEGCADHHSTLGTMIACTCWFRVEQIAREQCGGNVTNRKLHMHVHRIIIAVVLALVYRIRVSTIID